MSVFISPFNFVYDVAGISHVLHETLRNVLSMHSTRPLANILRTDNRASLVQPVPREPTRQRSCSSMPARSTEAAPFAFPNLALKNTAVQQSININREMSMKSHADCIK